MPEHNTIASAACHEPKHITDWTTSESGQIITNSSSVSGTSEYRRIVEGDVDDITDLYYVTIDDVSTAQSAWVVVRNAGTIEKIHSVIDGTLATADANITTEISGTAVTNGGLTIAFTGSAAGDIDTATPTALNSVASGQAIEVITDGASTNTVKAVFTIEVKRS